MKHIITFALIGVVTLVAIVACVKEFEDEGISSCTEYIGKVINAYSNNPLEGVSVQITNGTYTYASTVTDNQGGFDIPNINFHEIDASYHLWIDGSSIGQPSMKEDLKGVKQKKYDYQNLVLRDKVAYDKLPIFKYNGHTYKVAPDDGSVGPARSVTRYGYGYSDWRSPTLDELQYMYSKRSAIGGFVCTIEGYGYWSSTETSDRDLYYYVDFYDGDVYRSYYNYDKHYRLIRVHK